MSERVKLRLRHYLWDNGEFIARITEYAIVECTQCILFASHSANKKAKIRTENETWYGIIYKFRRRPTWLRPPAKHICISKANRARTAFTFVNFFRIWENENRNERTDMAPQRAFAIRIVRSINRKQITPFLVPRPASTCFPSANERLSDRKVSALSLSLSFSPVAFVIGKRIICNSWRDYSVSTAISRIPCILLPISRTSIARRSF